MARVRGAGDHEVPPSGPLAEVDRLLHARRTDDALAELERVAKQDWNLVVDAIGLLSAQGEEGAAREAPAGGRSAVRGAIEGHIGFAAGSTGAGEGMGRMVDVDRMRVRVAELKGRQ
jgi:hypothetical protein